MTPKELVLEWIKRFNCADISGLVALYAENAINDQVVFEKPMQGRQAIEQMFLIEFGRAQMTCIAEHIFEIQDHAILQWRDPNGLRGCGFFHIQNGLIQHQKGYFDQLSFFRLQGLDIPEQYLS
ncbi:MAG: nuclear transport factor 2 family protein [Bdellovibrionota bacterium]|nr:nuclear transport factor 2 family protein [Deltaproteobacteria bacterium]